MRSLVVSRRRLVPMSGYHLIPLWLRAACLASGVAADALTAAPITVAPHWECFPAVTLRKANLKTPE